jgi:hypothetical protein
MSDFRVAYVQGACGEIKNKGLTTSIVRGKFNSNLNIFGPLFL